MIDLFREVSQSVRLEIPRANHRKIAIIGAGGIVSGAHLPAYALAGLPIAGIFDVDSALAQQVAQQFGIPQVFDSLEDLLADDSIQVVDIAVPASAQPEILHRALDSGKDVLAQKPLSLTAEEALELHAHQERSGRAVAVNQQMRFEESIAAAHHLVSNGWIGTVSGLSITVNVSTPWELWPWAKSMERLEIMIHSIHYHDVVRWFLGDPEKVFAVQGRTQGQYPEGETRTASTYLYTAGPIAVVQANHVNLGGDNSATFRIDGDQGSIRGTIGLLYDYPEGRLSTLEVSSQNPATDGWVPYPVTTRWFPHAFIGSMGSLLAHLHDGSPLRSSLEDNVNTVRLIEALYASIDSGEATSLR